LHSVQSGASLSMFYDVKDPLPSLLSGPSGSWTSSSCLLRDSISSKIYLDIIAS
jgi:hypothetical protein